MKEQFSRLSTIDEQIEKLQAEISILKEERNEICQNIMEIMTDKGITESKIRVRNTEWRIQSSNVREGITQKYLVTQLAEIIPNITEKQSEAIVRTLYNNRGTKTKQQLVSRSISS